MSKIVSNKSKTYLLPLLSELVDFDKKYYDNLINTYIYDDLDKYENCIFILHKFSFKNPEYTQYEHRLVNNDLFIDLIDIDDSVLYIFKFPEEYLEEYNNFKVGRYSKYETDAKELILNFFGNIYKSNPNAVSFLLKIKQILFKDSKLKRKIEKELNAELPSNAELSSIMNKSKETFSLSKYIEAKENDKNKDKTIS